MLKSFIRVFVTLVLVAGIALAIVFRDALDVAALEVWVKDAGVAGPIVLC